MEEILDRKKNTVLAKTSPSLFTISDLLVSYLDQLGIKYVFGIPGGAIEPLYNALAVSERHNGPRAIVARHESGAAFMASGYTHDTGRIGVCCATTGPGTTNLITGVASAYANHEPLLVITAQTSIANFGKGAFQESSCTGINTVGMMEYCTRYNTLVSHADQFEHKLTTALMTALSSPCGPVHLSIPLDILRTKFTSGVPNYDIAHLLTKPSLLDYSALDQLCNILSISKTTLFVIGEGASEAIGDIQSIATHFQATLLTTPHGKGLISPYHPLFCGVVGFAGHQCAVDALEDKNLDTVISIGTTFGEWGSNGWDKQHLLNSRLIHIDEQEYNFTYSPMARLHVRGNISEIFNHLKNNFLTQDSSHPISRSTANSNPGSNKDGSCIEIPVRRFSLDDEESYHSDSSPIKPPRLMRLLPKLFPPNTCYIADTGNSFTWATHYLHPYDRRITGKRNARGGLFRACFEFSSMGAAIGCAVGTALARKGQPVVCLTGDGSFLMSGQEITVAVQEKLPVIFIILNDSCLGMVKHGQRLAGAESIGTAIPPTDFSAFAQSMGAQAFSIDSPEDLMQLDIDEIINRPGPTLLDVHIDTEAVPPMGMRMKVLQKDTHQ